MLASAGLPCTYASGSSTPIIASLKTRPSCPGLIRTISITGGVRPNDPRVFCPTRWAASRALPDLLRRLDERIYYVTRRRNHFAVKRDQPTGHYVMYFRVERKVTGGASIRLFAESAYHREDLEDVLATAERTSILDILIKT